VLFTDKFIYIVTDQEHKPYTALAVDVSKGSTGRLRLQQSE
jgi:hypothetical protein